MSEPDSLDTKQRILSAAEAEFLARGYDRSRMQAIADRAGINKALLHYHFGSKDDLFAAIFREKASQLFPRVEASMREHSDFIAFACAFVELYISYLRDNPFLPFYLLQVSAHHPELLAQVPNQLPSKLLRAFEAAARSGEIAPHDPRQFVVSVLGMCVMPFVGRNLIKHMLSLDDRGFEKLLQARAQEVERYVVLLLTPPPRPRSRARSKKGR